MSPLPPPPLPARAVSWACLEDCGDAFEGVLACLERGDVAACRLVSRAWRHGVDLLLQQLEPAAGAEPAALAAAFPHLTSLQLTAAPPPSSGGEAGGASSGASGGAPGSTAVARLPPLGALVTLRRLRRLQLVGAGTGGAATSTLDCRQLLPLAGVTPLADVEASALQLHAAAALQQLTQLTRLHLAAAPLRSWHGSLPSLLAPLRRLEHLRYAAAPPLPATAAAAAPPAGGAAPGQELAAAVAAAGAAAEPPRGDGSGLLDGLCQLTSLRSLELSCPHAGSDGVCAAVAALPRLQRLAIARGSAFGHAAGSVSDAGLAALAAGLARQLTSLSLTGQQGVNDEGLRQLGRCTALLHLDLRLEDPALPPRAGGAPAASGAGVAALAALTRLQSLHLGGGLPLGEACCAALAGRLVGLTSLQLTDCADLADPALYKLAPLAPRLRRLGLCGCVGVTDRALAVLLRGAARLARLELAGCHRNITGVGLQGGALRRLRHLDLAGCEAITDGEMEALLAAAPSLEHLNLSDCRVTDAACALLAAASPSLRWLSLEHCSGVSDRGLCCLAAGLPLLSELRLFGSGVTSAAAAAVLRAPRGRRLRLSTSKHCWWVVPKPAAAAPALPAAASSAAAAH